jgi:hypothetical protein
LLIEADQVSLSHQRKRVDKRIIIVRRFNVWRDGISLILHAYNLKAVISDFALQGYFTLLALRPPHHVQGIAARLNFVLLSIAAHGYSAFIKQDVPGPEALAAVI